VPDVVAESEHSLAFRDINPQAPDPRARRPEAPRGERWELAKSSSAEETADLVELAGRWRESEGLVGGYRLVFNTGVEAGQTVFHAHLHVLGGRQMEWPPG
jgi:histidine triad (HIT) family protein